MEKVNDLKHTTSSSGVGMYGYHGTGSLVFIEGYSSKMNSEVYKAIALAHLQPVFQNTLDSTSVQMESDPKQTSKAKILRQSSVIFCNGQVNHLT